MDLARRRLAARPPGAPSDAAALEDSLRRSPADDVFLAVACERDVAGAWDVLHRRYLPRLRGLGQRHGLAGTAADALARDLLGELALPPVRGGARTRLGTYLGAGTLFGWLALILVRRIGASRTAAPRPGDPAPEAAFRGDEVASARADARDPGESAAAAETAHRAAERIDRAWAELSPRERLVLVWKHVDGVSQQEIARRIDVGEPRVSRIVQAAIGRLRDAVTAADDPEAAPGGLAWGLLRDALQRRLTTEAALATPPLREGPAPGGPPRTPP